MEENVDTDLDPVMFLVGPEVEEVHPGWLEQGVSIGLDLIPVVGQVKGAWQVITGKDLVTGEEVNRWVELAGLIPFGKVISVGKKAVGALKHGQELTAFVTKGCKAGAKVQKITKVQMLKLVEELKLPKDLYKPGKFTAEQIASKTAAFEQKKLWLKAAIQEGKASITTMSKELRKEANAGARKFRAHLEELHKGNRDMLKKIKDSDIDHMLDVQMGGLPDAFENMDLLDKTINRSVGSQLQHGLKTLQKETTDVVATSLTDMVIAKSLLEGGLPAAKKLLMEKQVKTQLSKAEQHILNAKSLIDLDPSQLEMSEAAGFHLLGLQKDMVDTVNSTLDAEIKQEDVKRQQEERSKEERAQAELAAQQVEQAKQEAIRVEKLEKEMKELKERAEAERNQEQRRVLQAQLEEKRQEAVAELKKLDNVKKEFSTAKEREGAEQKTLKEAEQHEKKVNDQLSNAENRIADLESQLASAKDEDKIHLESMLAAYKSRMLELRKSSENASSKVANSREAAGAAKNNVQALGLKVAASQQNHQKLTQLVQQYSQKVNAVAKK